MPDDKRIAVLGAGMHPWGKWGRNFVEYGLTAARAALADAGLAIDEGALYPMLRRLETQGLLTSEWREEEKRKKRFYLLSPGGAEVLDGSGVLVPAHHLAAHDHPRGEGAVEEDGVVVAPWLNADDGASREHGLVGSPGVGADHGAGDMHGPGQHHHSGRRPGAAD